MQLTGLRTAARVLHVEIDAVAVRRAEDRAQHREVHFVVPVVVGLVEARMIQQPLVGHHQPAKAQPLVGKEQIHQRQIETGFGGRDLGPLRLEIMRKVVLGLERAPSLISAEHTSELQSLMRYTYAVFRLKKKNE